MDIGSVTEGHGEMSSGGLGLTGELGGDISQQELDFTDLFLDPGVCEHSNASPCFM